MQNNYTGTSLPAKRSESQKKSSDNSPFAGDAGGTPKILPSSKKRIPGFKRD
jgi:hypothetical protein